MNSDLPKVLHTVGGKPMLHHVVDAARALAPEKIIVAAGPGQQNVVDAVPNDCMVVPDVQQKGTGYAVRMGIAGLDLTDTDVLVLFGDVPLVNPDDLKALVARHQDGSNADVTILAMRPQNPYGYGRLVCDLYGHVLRVVEELDAQPDERKIGLCSSGLMILRGEKLPDYLSRITNNNAKGEYYLLDILPLILADGGHAAYNIGSADDLAGVNTPEQLAAIEKRYSGR